MREISAIEQIDTLPLHTHVFGGTFFAQVIDRIVRPPDEFGEQAPDVVVANVDGRTLIWEDPRPGAQIGVSGSIDINDAIIRQKDGVRILRCYGTTSIDVTPESLPDVNPPASPGTVEERLQRLERAMYNIKLIIERDL